MSAASNRIPVSGVRAIGGALVAAALSVGLLAGCGPSGSGHQAASAPATPSATTSSSGSSGPSESAGPSSPPASGRPGPSHTVGGGAPPSARPPSAKPPTGDLETHRGTVTRGAEPSCLILKSPDGQYELVGADQQARQVLRPDASVVVHGYLEKGLMSHCMQGRMFKVVSAQRAG